MLTNLGVSETPAARSPRAIVLTQPLGWLSECDWLGKDALLTMVKYASSETIAIMTKKYQRHPTRGMNDESEYAALAELWALRGIQETTLLSRMAKAPRWYDDELLRLVGISDKCEKQELSTTKLRKVANKKIRRLEEAATTRGLVVYENVAELAALLDLSDVDQALLAFTLVLELDSTLQACLRNAAVRTVLGLSRVLAAMLAVETSQVQDSLRATSPLGACGLVTLSDEKYWSSSEPLEVLDDVKPALLRPRDDGPHLLNQLLRPCDRSALSLADFVHLERTTSILLRILHNALGQRARGVNFLLYGPPGTGKTELAKVLARQLGVDLHAVSVSDADGDALDADQRFKAYQFTQSLLQKRGRALVMFDEIEDVFPDHVSAMRESRPPDLGGLSP